MCWAVTAARHCKERVVNDLFDDQKRTLRDCVERLERLSIPYMLTGSMAMTNYAMMRMTNDIDIVTFEPDYYVPHNRVADAISRKFMFNLLNQQTLVKIDLVVLKATNFSDTHLAGESGYVSPILMFG